MCLAFSLLTEIRGPSDIHELDWVLFVCMLPGNAIAIHVAPQFT